VWNKDDENKAKNAKIREAREHMQTATAEHNRTTTVSSGGFFWDYKKWAVARYWGTRLESQHPGG
jgi:hypothetical protein